MSKCRFKNKMLLSCVMFDLIFLILQKRKRRPLCISHFFRHSIFSLSPVRLRPVGLMNCAGIPALKSPILRKLLLQMSGCNRLYRISMLFLQKGVGFIFFENPDSKGGGVLGSCWGLNPLIKIIVFTFPF